MDIKRTILIVALAIVAYVMVLKWNQDYGQAALPTQNVASTPVSSADIPGNPAPQAGADVPNVSSEPNAAAVPTPTANGKDLIRVKTDVIDLAIDPTGGDIVQLTLPGYPRRQDRPEVPFQLFDNGGERTYVAQSGLIGTNGPDSRSSGRPLFASEQKNYQLADGQDQLVVDLKFSDAGVNYIKRFSFKRGEYDLVVSYLIDNQSAQPWTGNLFAQLKRDHSDDPSASTATSTATYLGAALWTSGEPYKKVSMKDMDKGNVKEAVQGGWVAWLQHYFVTAWIPASTDTNTVTTRKDSQGNYIIGYTGPAISAAAGGKAETTTTLYAGPKIQDKLKALSPGLELTVDYGILWFIAQPIFWLLKHIHAILGNWGFSIICLTILIKPGCVPWHRNWRS
jgi:YidC/Oxa1 family membrane protein insertase